MNLRALAAAATLVLTSAPLLGAASLPGIRASGTLVTQVTVSGLPISLGGDVAMYHRGALYRLDIRDLRIPGADATTSALMQQFLPAGGISVLYDGATGTATAWSNAARAYYVVSSPVAPTSAPAYSQQNLTGGSTGDPLAGLAAAASVMRDMESGSLILTGHKTINGHPTTDVDIAMKRQLAGKPPEDYHLQLAFADDLSEFPIQLTLQSTAATRDALGGTFKIDLTTVQRETPPDSDFVLPSGYTRVTSMQGLLGHSAP